MSAAIRKSSRGARFVRADLHIHSYGPGGSFDVKDSTMTPEAIVAEAVRLGLGVIAITDHNSIGNVAAAVACATSENLLVVPGVELSTPGGHLLVYAEAPDALARIYGQLSFSKDRKDCRTSVADILAIVSQHDGCAIAAHVDRDSGIEAAIAGYGDAKASVFESPTLVAIEVALKQNLDWFSADDPDDARRALFERRIAALGDPFTRVLPRIQSSDAHAHGALGRNWSNEDKLTRLKMSRLDWVSFRTAFADPEARVRVENEVPSSIPRFVGLRIHGGFLHEQTFAFGDNLTCIIGGRGSGKSTAFHILQAICGRDVPDELTASDVWPERACAVFRDDAGQEFELLLDETGLRCREGGVDSDLPVVDFSSLAQGEMARTIQGCRTDPGVLLTFLDELLDLDDVNAKIEECRAHLERNGRSLVQTDTDLTGFDDLKRKLETKRQQSEAFRVANGTDLVKKQQALTAAIRVRRELLAQFEDAVSAVNTGLSELPLEPFGALADGAEGLVERAEDSPFEGIAQRIEAALDASKSAVGAAVAASRPEITAFVARVQAQQERMQQEIAAELQKLQDKGITPDMKFLSRVTGEIDQLETQIKKLERMKTSRIDLIKERNALRATFRDLHSQRFVARQALADRLTVELRRFLVDWEISVKFKEARLAPSFETRLKTIMEWKTAAVPKAPALVSALGVPGFLDAVTALIGKQGDRTALQAAKGPDGQPILSKWDIDVMAEKLSVFSNRRQLQEETYDDLPRIVITRRVTDAAGKPTGKALQREFAQLSLGQQQAIVLAILLSVPSNKPLIVDQPEDNLDGEFIFQILVRALRQIKEHRQVILITHNANIAVLGDSDQVIPLKPQADRSVVLDTGTVENPKTRELVCGILEGGQAAYRKRGQLYGL